MAFMECEELWRTAQSDGDAAREVLKVKGKPASGFRQFNSVGVGKNAPTKP